VRGSAKHVFIGFGGPQGHANSFEDAAEHMPARMPARPAESPRHERIFIGFGGPWGQGDSFEDAVLKRRAPYRSERF
jgi:hypothetical protein